MRPYPEMHIFKTTLLIAGASLTIVSVGCGGGGDEFDNDPRPPSRVELTGVITEERVTISPEEQGAGAILITISNQDDRAHTVTLDGEGVRERVGPVQPNDTAKIRKTLEPGIYEVKAGSSQAVAREVEPAVLTIGPERQNSNNELLQP